MHSADQFEAFTNRTSITASQPRTLLLLIHRHAFIATETRHHLAHADLASCRTIVLRENGRHLQTPVAVHSPGVTTKTAATTVNKATHAWLCEE